MGRMRVGRWARVHALWYLLLQHTSLEFIRCKLLPESPHNHAQATTNKEFLDFKNLYTKKEKCEVIHIYRFPEANTQHADRNSTKEPCVTQKCPPISFLLSLSIPNTQKQKTSLISFLKLCKTNTTNGKLPLDALAFQSLWMREVISLNCIAGIFPLSFQFKIQCLFFSGVPMPSPHISPPTSIPF